MKTAAVAEDLAWLDRLRERMTFAAEFGDVVAPPPVQPEDPGLVLMRLRRRKAVVDRHQERAEGTLVAGTASGVIVIAHPDQPEQWAKATDPDTGPAYLRTNFGVLDPTSVKLMSAVPDCMLAPWTAEEDAALADAEQAEEDEMARRRAYFAQPRPEYEAWLAKEKARHDTAVAEREKRTSAWGQGRWDDDRTYTPKPPRSAMWVNAAE